MTTGLTWKEWKRKIRAALDARPLFDIDTTTIDYLDVVWNEECSVSTGANGLVGLDSVLKPADIDIPEGIGEGEDE